MSNAETDLCRVCKPTDHLVLDVFLFNAEPVAGWSITLFDNREFAGVSFMPRQDVCVSGVNRDECRPDPM
jgi:hypothetical protein